MNNLHFKDLSKIINEKCVIFLETLSNFMITLFNDIMKLAYILECINNYAFSCKKKNK